MGGRLAGEVVDGFSIDSGADFFCSSYDVAFRICDELGLPLVRSQMKLGWFRNGRWVTSTPGLSGANLLRNVPAAMALGLMSPKALWPEMRLFKEIYDEPEFLNFSSSSRLAEHDGDETFGEHLDRLGIPDSVKMTFQGFLEMTMGHVELSGESYMRAYLAEMLVHADQIYVPENGAATLAKALAEKCSDAIRVATPVNSVVIRDGAVSGVAVEDEVIEADAVICAVPPSKAVKLIPDLPSDVRQVLGDVKYSTGCRVVIGLDHPPLPLGWNGALYPEDDTPLMLDRSINLPECVPEGMSTLDLLVGRERAEELISLDDGEIKCKMLGQVRKNPPPGSSLPDDDEGVFTRVYRWQEAVCMGLPGMFKDVAEARRNLGNEVKNLFLAGDYTRVPSVNGALTSGVETAEEVANMLASDAA